MLRPGGVARPALARAFTTKLSWAGSPRSPTLVMTEWLIVTYHCRTFTGWTGSLMGCEQRTQSAQSQRITHPLSGFWAFVACGFPLARSIFLSGSLCSLRSLRLNSSSPKKRRHFLRGGDFRPEGHDPIDQTGERARYEDRAEIQRQRAVAE